ncbi:hypothetical protein ACWIGI_28720 [Nocardia sp. NPDC055321]
MSIHGGYAQWDYEATDVLAERLQYTSPKDPTYEKVLADYIAALQGSAIRRGRFEAEKKAAEDRKAKEQERKVAQVLRAVTRVRRRQPYKRRTYRIAA